MIRRKSVRILLALLAVVLLLVVAVMVFLPKEKIRDLALEQARERLGREVNVGDVSVSLMGGLGVRLADFVVQNPDGFVGEPLAAAEALDVKLAIKPLLKKEIRVARLVLDKPFLNLMVRADGSNNYTFTPVETAPSGSGTTPNEANAGAAVSIDNFELKEGTFVFSTPEQTTRFNEINGSFRLTDPAPGQFSIQGNVTADQMLFSALEPALPLPVEASYDLLWDNNSRRLDIKKVEGTVAGFAVAGQGDVQVADAGPTTRMNGQAQDLDLAELWSLIQPMLPPDQQGQLAGRGNLDLELLIPQSGPEQMEYQGTVGVRGASYTDAELGTTFTGVQGSLDLVSPAPEKVTIKGNLKAEQMAFAQMVPAPDLPVDATYDLLWDNTAQRLDIQGFQGTVAGIPLGGQGSVTIAESGPTTQLKGKAQNVDLAQLWSLVQPMMPPEQKGKLAGHGDLNLDLKVGPGGVDQMTYQGSAVFRKASYTETELIDELQAMDAELQFDQNKFTVTRSDLVFNSGRFKLTGTLRDPFPYFLPPEMQKDQPIKKPHLEFVLRSPRLDVDRLIPAASPSGAAVAGGSQPQGKPAAVPLTMEFPDLTASGTFQADSLIYMQVPFTQVTGKMSAKNRVLTCSEVKGAVFGGQVDGQVDMDLNDLNDPVYGGSYQAKNIEVDNFMQRFVGLAGVMFGGASMSGNFNAHGRDPDVIRNSLTLASDAQVVKGRLVTKGQFHGTLAQLAQQTGHTLGGEQTLRDLVTRIKVDQGRVGLDNLSMKLGEWGDLKFAGYYSFTGNLDYSGNLLLTPEQTDRLFARGVLAELAKLLGTNRPARLELPLTVGGTRSDPKIKLDLGTVTGDLQQKALAEQKGKLENEAKDKLNDKLNSLLNKWK